jgi:alpha-L-fucosidase
MRTALTLAARMEWWRDARFGMFIHWGLYAIPAGQWGDRTDLRRVDPRLRPDPRGRIRQAQGATSTPLKFDAEEIVLAAKNAGMKYIVITSKHHDGFCLFNSKVTDWDVMSTPFKRDIMKEMADACARHGLRMCWYHSIMDWHHPDYLPRRPWETRRPPRRRRRLRPLRQRVHEGQLTELLTNYGPIGVCGSTASGRAPGPTSAGRTSNRSCRSLQPGIIINSRVGRAGGAFGLEGDTGMLGDYATPEQTIPEPPSARSTGKRA